MMKKLNNSEIQSRLNGYTMSVAALLESVNGVVSLTLLKKLVAEYNGQAVQMGATQDNLNIAMFWTCNNFNIKVDG